MSKAQKFLDMLNDWDYADVIFEASIEAVDTDSCEEMTRYIFSDGSVFVDCSDGDYYVE